jgi:hypothetical protein
MRPRALTAIPWSFAHALMAPLCWRLDEARPDVRRGPRPALRACWMKGASRLRNAFAFFSFRSISYSGATHPEPNRLGSWATIKIVFECAVIFVAILTSQAATRWPAPYKIERHIANYRTAPGGQG